MVVSSQGNRRAPGRREGDGFGLFSGWFQFFRAQRTVAQHLESEKELLGFCPVTKAQWRSVPPEQSPAEDQGTLGTHSQAWLPALSLLISLER